MHVNAIDNILMQYITQKTVHVSQSFPPQEVFQEILDWFRFFFWRHTLLNSISTAFDHPEKPTFTGNISLVSHLRMPYWHIFLLIKYYS